MALRALKPWHREVMRQQYIGRSHAEIAETLGKKPQAISAIASDPTYKKELALFERAMVPHTVDVRARFEELSPKAVNTLEEVMDTADDASQRRLAANDILDRAGYPRSTKVEGSNGVTLQIPIERINILMEALRESKAIDITPEPARIGSGA